MCHSREDQSRYMAEVEYMKKFRDHPNIISLEGVEVVAVNNPASSVVSKILVLMPFYSVSLTLPGFFVIIFVYTCFPKWIARTHTIFNVVIQ